VDFLYYIVACLSAVFVCIPLFSIANSLETIAKSTPSNGEG
tara:strand:+ start:601 stop:723 length:123 start_codon:yes stop_codon:yes gene_type:complete